MRGNAQADAQELIRRYLKDGAVVPPSGKPAGGDDAEQLKEAAEAAARDAQASLEQRTHSDKSAEGNEDEERAKPEQDRKRDLPVLTGCRIGVDAGSKTIKVVVVDEDGKIVHEVYHRHRLDIRTTLLDQIENMLWWYGDIEGTIAITGSAGIAVAEMLGLPFVQEVIATTLAIQTDFPETDCIIELGGEDAKVIYLTGGLEQRMNATCAGGTGGFIDTIASMLGVRSKQMSSLALGANHIYPIASRCAVFAQTDVRPLLNAGASKADIAASAHEAVVRQAIGGLACGRPIRGNVVFLGGPLEHIPDLVMRFRKALELNAKTGRKPDKAHLYTAKGAAYYSGELEGEKASTIRLSELVELLKAAPEPEDDMDHLPPLFESEEEYEEFKARHEAEVLPRRQISDAVGPFYLGIDAGSTSIKLAVVDSEGYLVHSEYQLGKGDLLNTASKMLINLHMAMPYNLRKDDSTVRIAYAAATGYGEELLRAGLGIDSGVVETAAHLKAAQQFRPDVSFVFDIGGQDMKAMWIRDGAMSDVVLNEACSSGCGAFVSSIARSLRVPQDKLSDEALKAKNPIDLGTKCTVFMNSRVKHAQKVGASRADIAAGVAYSVVHNALYRIIGRNKTAEMGNVVIAQGGTFKSDAVLRAFELVSGTEVIRPNTAHLMGAIGAALIARERAQEMVLQAQERGEAIDGRFPASTLLSDDELRKLNPEYRSTRCPGCDNNCPLSIVTFSRGRHFVTGNRCERAKEFILPDGRIKYMDARQKQQAQETIALSMEAEETGKSTTRKPPNAITVEQRLIKAYKDKQGDVANDPLAARTIGIMNTLHGYEATPFWHTLFAGLGFSVMVPEHERTVKYISKSSESVPSESVCQPAKITHARMYELIENGADVIFMPAYKHEMCCPVQAGYAYAASDSVPYTARGDADMVSPYLESETPARLARNEQDKETLFQCLADLARPYGGLERKRFDAVFAEALAEQDKFISKVKRATQRALDWVDGGDNRHGIVVVGRTCHMDPDLLHGIDGVIEDLGMAVIPLLGIIDQLRALPPSEAEKMWSPAKRFNDAARFAVANPNLDLVILRSFNCGFDAVTCDVVRELMAQEKRLFTELKIDDIVDTAHIRIRLRTLAEAIETRKRERRDQSENEFSTFESDGAQVLTADDAEPASKNACEELHFGIGRDDLAISRSKVTSDLCFTAAALTAHAVIAVRNNPGLSTLRVPHVCQKCLVESLPSEVKRICGVCPEIEWVDDVPSDVVLDENLTLDAFNALPSGNKLIAPSIGIIGNPLLCFDSFMNEGVVDLLEELGCQVVLPEPQNLFVDDVRYFDQLDKYYEAGVDHVIYLQSFSCLKGHVDARGAQRQFAKRYPSMPITVLDYDPESSALNRENRIRLAVHAATIAKRSKLASEL